MFNKVFAIVIFSLSAALGTSGVFAQQQKIAVVDIQSAILGSSYGQQQLERLNADPEYAELMASARSLQADIQALDRDAQTNAAQWNEERFATYNRQREFKLADLQLTQQKLQAEQERVVNAINRTLNNRAMEALEQLIADEGVTLLLRESAVYQASAEHNLTAKLAAKLSQ